MSEAAENIDNPDDQTIDTDLDKSGEQFDDNINEPDQISESELQARTLGWKPKEDFSGDPEDWNTHRGFLKNREIIENNKSLRSDMDRMSHDFNQRLDGVNRLHEQSLKQKVEELKTKRDSAAQEADMDTYREANKQLDELEKTDVSRETTTQPSQQDVMVGIVNHPTTQAFINDNQWIKGNDAKAVYGQKVFTDWISANANNPGAILEDGLEHVKQLVNQQFKQTNPNLDNAQQMSERGQGNRKTQQRNSLTMDDLDPAERGIWRSMGSTWKDQADFLQAVADARKGE